MLVIVPLVKSLVADLGVREPRRHVEEARLWHDVQNACNDQLKRQYRSGLAAATVVARSSMDRKILCSLPAMILPQNAKALNSFSSSFLTKSFIRTWIIRSSGQSRAPAAPS